MSDQPTNDPIEQPEAQLVEHPVDKPVEPPVEPAYGRSHAVTPATSFSADVGGLIAGAVFTVLGVLFLLEAGDVWTFSLSDLRYLAPLALIVIGGAVLVGGVKRTDAKVDAA